MNTGLWIRLWAPLFRPFAGFISSPAPHFAVVAGAIADLPNRLLGLLQTMACSANLQSDDVDYLSIDSKSLNVTIKSPPIFPI